MTCTACLHGKSNKGSCYCKQYGMIIKPKQKAEECTGFKLKIRRIEEDERKRMGERNPSECR